MKHTLRLLTALLLVTVPAWADLVREFANPPPAARPEVIWYWRHELHTKEGITADLEAMNRVGIGGVLIGFIGGHDEPKGDVTILSPKWREMFRHAVVEAQRLGIRVNMWNSPGWSSGVRQAQRRRARSPLEQLPRAAVRRPGIRTRRGLRPHRQCAMTGFGTASLKAWPDWLLGKVPWTSGRHAFASRKHWNKDAALLPSGLLGPVRLLEAREIR